ncbi:MAG TPA: carboxypeptidase-like regulatory domain-containing protein, partial [Chitinophagaceae bacterium]
MNFKHFLTILLLPLLLHDMAAQAQNRAVTGTVVDAKSGLPLPGVTVVLKGTNMGATTGADGSFRLNAQAGAQTLVVSYIGYATREIAITGNKLSVALQPSNANLNELVVIGYGTQQKKDLTGAIATVDAKDFQKGAITSPDQLISGKIAGVSVTSTGGAPGGGSTIRIRGLASLNGNNNPLIVIDGVPLAPNK